MASTTTETQLAKNNFAVTRSRVEVQIHCDKIKWSQKGDKIFPLAVLMEKVPGTHQYKPLGRTELYKESSGPIYSASFKRKLQADYTFEKLIQLRVGIYLLPSAHSKLVSAACAGMLDFSLSSALMQGFASGNLQGGFSSEGAASVEIKEMPTCRQRLHLQFSAQQLDDLDFFTKSDPFIEISRAVDDVTIEESKNTEFTFVHRTEVIANNLNPVWKPFTVPLHTLCLGDTWRALKIEVFDADYDEKRDFIGSCITSVDHMFSAKPTLPIINKKKKLKKKNYVNSGYLSVKMAQLEDENTLLQYFQTTSQLVFCSAVDFTNSNGMAKFPTSLHFIDPSPLPQPNQYQICLECVGNILDAYSKEKKHRAFGFGAFTPNDLKRVSFEFPLNLNPDAPACYGVKSVLDAYCKSALSVQQYGPTDITPVIRRIMELAAVPSPEKFYYVLLILIDGVVSDFESARRALVMASNLPMSIILMGVGEENFRKMEELDGKRKRLKADGTSAARDNVRFFQVRDFMRRGGLDAVRTALTRAVLGDLPQHVFEYKEMRR